MHTLSSNALVTQLAQEKTRVNAYPLSQYTILAYFTIRRSYFHTSLRITLLIALIRQPTFLFEYRIGCAYNAD